MRVTIEFRIPNSEFGEQAISKPGEVAEEIERLGEAFAVLVEALDAAVLHGRASEDAWSIAEIAGHASEFPRTFGSKALELSRNPGMAFGRGLDDPGRLSGPTAMGTATPTEASQRLREASQDSGAFVRRIDPANWAVTGTRPDGTSIAVGQILGTLVRDHLRGHLEQARATSSIING